MAETAARDADAKFQDVVFFKLDERLSPFKIEDWRDKAAAAETAAAASQTRTTARRLGHLVRQANARPSGPVQCLILFLDKRLEPFKIEDWRDQAGAAETAAAAALAQTGTTAAEGARHRAETQGQGRRVEGDKSRH